MFFTKEILRLVLCSLLTILSHSVALQFSAKLLERSHLDLTSRFVVSSRGADGSGRAWLLLRLMNEHVLVAATTLAATHSGLSGAAPGPAMKLLFRECEEDSGTIKVAQYFF